MLIVYGYINSNVGVCQHINRSQLNVKCYCNMNTLYSSGIHLDINMLCRNYSNNHHVLIILAIQARPQNKILPCNTIHLYINVPEYEVSCVIL